MDFKRASEHFNIKKEVFAKTGAFDSVIGVDSLFFVDPVRLKETTVPEFKSSINKIRKYYSDVITLIKIKNPRAKKEVIKRLKIKEIKGIGIGYGNKSDDGSAIGPKLAQKIFTSAEEIIEMGVTDPAIFEIIGLFVEDFGPDRLSDSLIKILEENIYEYTEKVSKKLNIQADFKLKKGEKTYSLPKHPLANKALLFIPENILRDLPIVESFGDISILAGFNDDLREKFNRLIAPCFRNKEASKKEIKDYILENADRLKTLIKAYENSSIDAYNFKKDEKGLYRWLEKAREIVSTNPLKIPVSPTFEELEKVVLEIIKSFKNFIEIKGGWRMLYNDKMDTLNERHARLLFYAIANIYAKNENIDVSPESNAGGGPVDFKLSIGSDKIIVEIKLSKGSVKHGYEKQVKIYQEAEEAKKSYYVVLIVTKISNALEEIIEMSRKHEEEGINHPEIIWIDAKIRASASKA